MPFTNYSYATGLGVLQNAVDNINKRAADQDKKDTLVQLGSKIQSGDLAGAAQAAFAAGDPSTGLGILKLQQTKDSGAQFDSLLGQATGDAQPTMALGSRGAPASAATGAPDASAGPSAPAFAGGQTAMKLPADPEIENRFVSTLKAGGLTNPNGLAAVAAYANAESGYSPTNITGSWADPSQSGQPGTSGGILSWRGPRLAAMRQMTAGSDDPVAAQAKFMLTENPDLTVALQNAKTPEEAHSLMANAWRFAGYDQPGGENARRLAMTQAYLGRVSDAPAQAAQDDTTAAPASASPGVKVASADPSFVPQTGATSAVGATQPAPRPQNIGGGASSTMADAVDGNTSATSTSSRLPATASPGQSAASAPQLDAGSMYRLTNGAKVNPNAPAIAYASPNDVTANPDLFFNPDRSRKSAGEVMAALQGGKGAPAAPAQAQSATAAAPAAVGPANDPLVAVPGYNGGRPINKAWIDAQPDGADVPEDKELATAQAKAGGGSGVQIPAAGSAPPAGTDTQAVSANAHQTLAQAGMSDAATQVARTAPGSGRRLRLLAQAAALPGIGDGQRAVAMALFNNELSQMKMPDKFREYEIAVANSWTKAKNPTEYAAEQKAAEAQAGAKDEGDKIKEQIGAREADAVARGLDKGDPAVREWIQTGKYPKAQGQAKQTPEQLDQSRLAVLQSNGIDPASPEGQHYRLTGQQIDPGKAAEMKATEQKMYAANVEKTNILQQQIQDLTKARQLNPQVYSGSYEPGAAVWAGRNLPFGGMGLVDQNRVTATTQYENLVNGATLSQGKELFGARPTNYDEKLLQALKANPNMTPQERDTILGQMVQHRQQILKETQDNTAAMKAGTFFKRGGPAASTGGGAGQPSAPASQQPQSAVPSAAIAALRSDRSLAAQFDAKYGQGAAAQALGGQ